MKMKKTIKTNISVGVTIVLTIILMALLIWVSMGLIKNDNFCKEYFPSDKGSNRKSYSNSEQTEENYIKCCRYKLRNHTYNKECLAIPYIEK